MSPRALLYLAPLLFGACRDRAPGTAPETARAAAPGEHASELAALGAFEEQRRTATDFAALPPSDRTLGPDPYRLAALPDGRLAGILRGEGALVLLDRAGAELARIAAPSSPSGLAVARDGAILVVGEAARAIAQYRVAGANELVRGEDIAIDAIGMRDIALAGDQRTAYVVEEHDGRLLAVELARANHARRAASIRELARCHGPVQLAAIDATIAVDCVLDHAIAIHRDGATMQIHHDGPMWGFAMQRARDGGVLIATGGVEDHPLVREDGGFGYIDSFVALYRLPASAPAHEGPASDAARPLAALAAINVSELGVVTPKWLAIDDDPRAGLAITTAGYATPGTLTLRWPTGDPASPPTVERGALPPGTNAALRLADGTLVAANPLLDAWVVRAPDSAPRSLAVASQQPARSLSSRVGERLFFTTMLAPWNSSADQLSRFTCETCHHEGYVDGRVHFTGRDDVHAATRPLLGLFNNRPHFSRALDKTMTQMVHAEFRVANRHNGRDPWFALAARDAPWLAGIDGLPAELSPMWLRQAFMAFLMDFSHRSNPAAVDHAPRFTAREQRGAELFRDRCARCHEARLIADDPKSRVPFERWPALIFSPAGPIVWSNAAYAKTGVLPLVNPAGARVPALRRLYKKWPYFTNGSARSLDDVLARFADAAGQAYHAIPVDTAAQPEAAALLDAAALRALTDDEREALRAFLDLL